MDAAVIDSPAVLAWAQGHLHAAGVADAIKGGQPLMLAPDQLAQDSSGKAQLLSAQLVVAHPDTQPADDSTDRGTGAPTQKPLAAAPAPRKQQQQPPAAAPAAWAIAEEAPALASGTATPAAPRGATPEDAGGSNMVAEEPPMVPHTAAAVAAAAAAQQPAQARRLPPRLDVADNDQEAEGGRADPALDDSQWMQSPRRLKTPRGLPPSAAATPAAAADPAAAATAGAAAAATAAPAAAEGEEDEDEEGIRVGPDFQAALPDWRPRPTLRSGTPAMQALAAAALAADLKRVGPRGPAEAAALLIALQEKARAELLPPDAIDDLWERREPALALERGQRQRRAPGWMQEQFVHQLPGGSASGGRGGAADDEDDAANSSDHGGFGGGAAASGSARRSRKRGGSTPANSGGSSGPAAPRGTALAALQQQLGAAAGRARSGLSAASGGAVQLQQALAAAVAQPGTPHMIEWRTDEGRQAMEVAIVLGGQVFVGRLASRGPLLSWLPAGAVAAAAPAAAAPAPPAPAAPAPAPPARVKEESSAATAAPAFERSNSSDQGARRCSLCQGAGDAGLGPFMPVQIQNGQLEWVHRDCALWSPEVSVDSAGRMLSLAAAVRRGMDTNCTECGRRGATLACWSHRTCGCELHLPCARQLGCSFTDGDDPRFDGRRFVACPAHDPTTKPIDPEAVRAEFAARGASAAAAAAPAGPGVGGTEEIEAAELLTGIKRGSLLGSADSLLDTEPPVASAPPLSRRRSASAKRRRSGSGEASAACTDGGASGDENDEGDWAPPGRNSSGGGRSNSRSGKRRASSAAAAAAPPQQPPVALERIEEVADASAALAAGDPSVAVDLLQRLQSLTGSDGSAACGGFAAGAGLLQHLQPAAALLAPGGVLFGGALGFDGLPLPAAAAPAGPLGGTTGQTSRPGRCAVCVVQRKGKCGTDSAPKKCMRRQQAMLEQQMLEQKLRSQLAAQQDQLLLEQLQLAAAQELH